MTVKHLPYRSIVFTALLAAVSSVCLAATPKVTTVKAAVPRSAKFSGQTAYDLTKEFLATAPHRWIGSPDHAKAETFIKSHFTAEAAKGDFETDTFTASTPAGQLTMKNFIVRYPGKKDGVIVLASHYETNYPLRDSGFVGANDGACTSAFLIELGNYLRAHPPEGYSVWLVFDDGEEAIQSWSDRDSLYGTRHLAAKWSQDNTLKKIKAFIVVDMIGDKDLNIDRDTNSTGWLLDLLATAAKNTGHAGYVFKNQNALQDDHLPFRQRGVPVLDIIDIEYGTPSSQYPEGYHHTPLDTLDKISAHSLQITGDIVVELLHLIDQHG